MREFFISNATYWIREYHFDGLRLDATQDIHDASKEHVLGLITRRAREAAGKRSIIIVAENESQQSDMARKIEDGGYGIDALWNDDFHHQHLCRNDRAQRGLLHGLSRLATGICIGREIRLPLSGSVLPVAEEAEGAPLLFICNRGISSTIFRIMTRWRIRREATVRTF